MSESERRKQITAATALMLLAAALKSKPKRIRTVWVKDWLLKRQEYGAYNAIMNELRLTDKDYYRRYIRMDVSVFEVRVTLFH